MASMAELARQLLGMNGNSVGGVSPDRYMEVMDRSPYATGVPLKIGYGEQDQMSPLDAAAMVTGGVPVVGDLTGLAADVDMYMRDPESRNIPNYLLTAAGALPFLPAASQVRQGIKAYHGSPYNFPPVRELEMPDGAVVYQSMDDAVPEGAQVIAEHPLGRFDMSKIGTGEGAQAYGRGLYFAEAEDVAKGYRDSLTDFTELTIKQNGKVVKRGSNLTDDDLEAFKYLEAGLKSAGNFPHNREYYAKQHAERAGASEQVTALIDQYKNAEFSYEKPKGSMYEVDIDATPDDFLDYDKPLSEQSDRVKEALGIKGQQNKLLALQAKSNELQALYDKALSNVPSNQSFDDLFGDSAALRSEGELLTEKNRIDEEIKLLTTPKDFQLGDRKIPIRVQDYFSGANLIQGQGAASEISKQLLDKGIKGIKYLDQGSRAAGKGTSNYVIFDDRLITIAKKYGIAIPAAAAMLARMTGEDTSQSYQEAI
jgi:hypothetical protein